jgi:hypothetical protein
VNFATPRGAGDDAFRIDLAETGRRLVGNLQEDRKTARGACRLCETDVESGSHDLLRICGRRACRPIRDGRQSHQFLVAFAALGKMRHLVYRWLVMLVRHKFSLAGETPGYGISLKKAYMPMAVPRGATARSRSRLSETRTKR